MKKLVLLLYVIIVSMTIFSQEVQVCNNYKELHSAIDNIIKKDFYKDSTNCNVRVYFFLKIDSIGNIVSCRVLTPNNTNINEQYYTPICTDIENYIKVPFLYTKDTDCYPIEYCCWNYPFIKTEEEKTEIEFDQ